MYKSLFKIFSFIFMIFLYSLSLFAQGGAAQKVIKVSLEDCIKIALNNNPDIQLSELNEKIAINELEVTKSRNRPKVGLFLNTTQTLKDKYDDGGSEELSDSETPIPFVHTNTGLSSKLRFTYRLKDPGYVEQLDINHSQIDISKLDNKKNMDDIILSVKNNYYSYLHAKNIVKIRKQMKDNYEHRLQKTRVLVENGARPILDLSSIEVNFADVSLEYDAAINMEVNSKAELLNSMGVYEERVQFDVLHQGEDLLDPAYKVKELKFELKKLFKLAENNSIALTRFKYQKKISKQMIAQANALDDMVVDFAVSGGIINEDLKAREFQENYKASNWTPFAIVAFSASMPIYTGGAVTAKIEKANSNYLKTKFQERKLKLNLRKQIKTFFEDLKELKKRMNISNLNIKNAKTNLVLAQKSYLHGIKDQDSVNQAEFDYLKAQMTLLNARLSYIKTLASLANTIGVGEKYICK